MRTVRRDIAGPGMKSLTSFQVNRIRVGVRTVRRDTAGPGTQSLTSYQVNRTRVEMRTVRREIVGLFMLPTLYGIQPNIFPSKASLLNSFVLILSNCSFIQLIIQSCYISHTF